MIEIKDIMTFEDICNYFINKHKEYHVRGRSHPRSYEVFLIPLEIRKYNIKINLSVELFTRSRLPYCSLKFSYEVGDWGDFKVGFNGYTEIEVQTLRRSTQDLLLNFFSKFKKLVSDKNLSVIGPVSFLIYFESVKEVEKEIELFIREVRKFGQQINKTTATGRKKL